MDTDGFFESMPSADVWNTLWGQSDSGGASAITYETELGEDLLMAIENLSVKQEYMGICDGCGKELHGSYFHCLQCPNFDICPSCVEKELKTHPMGHEFQLRCWPFSDIPMDGSDLDHLQSLAKKELQHDARVPSYIRNLNEPISRLSDASREKYLQPEIHRAAQWQKLHQLYTRFEHCVSMLKMTAATERIPVPPIIAPFQKLMEENWDTGNAQETAYFMHLSSFDRADFSRDIDKMELGTALHEFVGEFMEHNGLEFPDNTIAAVADPDRLPHTPVETMDAADGDLVKSAITIEGVALHQWEYLEPRDELDLGKDMRKFQQKIVDIVSDYSQKPSLWSPERHFNITTSKHERSAGLADTLSRVQSLRRLGRFQEALTLLSCRDGTNAEAAFEQFRIFEDMGELHRCLQCVQDFHEAVSNAQMSHETPKIFLLKLGAAYIACFVRGQWRNAMKLALIAHRDYLSNTTIFDITTIEIEIYYHKIWLAVGRDLGETMVYDKSSARLTKLREVIQNEMLFPLAYEVLLIELDLAKQPHRSPKVPSYWSAREFNDFLDVPAIVSERVWSYLESLSTQRSNEDPFLLEEAHCRLRLAEILRDVALKSTEIELEMFFYQHSALQRGEALRIYVAYGCELGITNIALFDAKRPNQYDVKDDILEECDRICSSFRNIGSSKGMHETLLWKAKFLHTYFRESVKEPYSDLELVAHSSGNMYQWHHARMKKLQWWMLSTTLIDDCKSVFEESQGFLSSELGAIASLNLNRAYRGTGDLVQAEIAGYFHLLLVSCRNDNDHVYSALTNLLQIRNSLVLELPDSVRAATFSHWTQGILQILVNLFAQAVDLTAMGWRSRTYDIIKMLELILILPRAGANFNVYLQPEKTGLPSALHVYVPLLKLGMRLVELLPIFFWPTVLDEIGLTLGIVLENSGNHMLSLRTYHHSLLANHPGNKSLANKVKVLAGNLLVNVDHLNPGCYKYAKAVAMKAFMQAEPYLWSNVFTDESFKDSIWTSISLASCLFSVLMEDSSETDDDGTELLRIRSNSLVEACSSVIRRTVGQWQGIRRELLSRLTSDTLRHQRAFLSGKLPNKLLTIQLELAAALAQKENTGVGDLWRVVQQWKAISLSDLLWNSRSYIPRSDAIDEEVEALIKEEKSIVDKINAAEPYDRPSLRRKLHMHWGQMARHSEFAAFSTMKLGMGATLAHLAEVQQTFSRVGSENDKIVFVDWTRYRDDIILFAIRCSQAHQTVEYQRLSLTYPAVEDWVLRKLKQKSASVGAHPSQRKRLESASDLAELSPLIEPLRGMIKDEELIVLCPSGVLNEIPIHAIPFSGSDDPLIANYVIVYSSSHAITKSCVDMAVQKIDSDRSNTRFVAFGRFGDLDPFEDQFIADTVIDLKEQFHGIAVTGKDLKRDVFITSTMHADFIHYHGHATYDSDASNRALIFEPDPETGDSGKFRVDDIFQLLLKSPHVTLLACASGEQDFSSNDDPFGIVTAFLCAGATSVTATLWPTDSRDARAFCDLFYDQLKSEKGSVINLAKAMQRTVLTLREDWSFDDPYHWAQFVLYGSWLCRNFWNDEQS